MATPPRATTIWTIGSLLQWTTDFFTRKAIDSPRLSAELLLAFALDCTRMSLYTQYEKIPTQPQTAAFRELVKRRGEGTPVAYLIGKAWFFSLELTVNPSVLIPRPDTETLVENIITQVRQTPGYEAPLILDLCTGSGCIAIALAKNLPAAQMYATDISAAALAVAKLNASSHLVAERVQFFGGDLFLPLEALTPRPRFHIIASNPPYIARDTMPALQREVKDHEPGAALDGGVDGLEFIRRIITEATDWLAPAGTLIIEHGENQSPAVIQLMETAGYLSAIRPIRDAAATLRCVMATKKF